MSEPFRTRVEALLNSECAENESNTPDFILANYLVSCLEAFDRATNDRDRWYAVHLAPGDKHFISDMEAEPPQERGDEK